MEEKEEGTRCLHGLRPGGEYSHSGAPRGGRSHCWPVPGGAARSFLPLQPAGRAPVTELCCPQSSQAWPDSWQTGLCSAPALEGGRQQSLWSPGEEAQVGWHCPGAWATLAPACLATVGSAIWSLTPEPSELREWGWRRLGTQAERCL